MINLRYHIVSITAVFLALGIGVMLGGTYLDKYTVDQLDKNITDAERRIAETRGENNRLQGVIDESLVRERVLIDRGTPAIVGPMLTDVPVIVIAPSGIDVGALQDLQRTLSASGADFDGTLTLSGKVALDDGAASALATEMGWGDTDPGDVRRRLIDSLAQALVERSTPGGSEGASPDNNNNTNNNTTTITTDTPGVTTGPGGATTAPDGTPSSTATTAPSGEAGATTTTVPDGSGAEPPTISEPDIVTALRDLGLASLTPPEGGDPSAPVLDRTGYRYVIASGADAVPRDDLLVLPLLREIDERGGAPVVLVSAPRRDDVDATREAVVGPVRDDEELKASISTVDDLESFDGLLATVLALREMADGTHGHYGVGERATELIPTL